jgi:uncharacterized membrane protein
MFTSTRHTTGCRFSIRALAFAGTGLVALEHVYIMVLEVFLWTTLRGRKAFDSTPE